jgi:hypothetical protein
MEYLHWDEHRSAGPGDDAAFGGWNDAAAASGAVVYIGEQFGARRVASLDPEEFYDFQATRPLIDLSSPEASSIMWPEVELLVARPPDGPHDLLLVAGAEPSMRWQTFTRVLLDAATSIGVKRVVLLGSLLADVVHSHPVRLTGMASDPSFISGLGFRDPSYAGPTGIVGVLHHYASERGLGPCPSGRRVSHYAAGLTNPRAASRWCAPRQRAWWADVGERKVAPPSRAGGAPGPSRACRLVEQLETPPAAPRRAGDVGPSHRRRAGCRARRFAGATSPAKPLPGGFFAGPGQRVAGGPWSR